MKKLVEVLALVLFLFPTFLFAQDDLLKMLDETDQGDKKKDKSLNRVTAMFKDPAIINMQTPQTTGEGALNFNISHRFGSMGAASNGGVHTLYGWDAISDVRLSLDYGITRTLQVGMGRSKRDEAVDGSIKWRFLEQTLDNKIPLSACLFAISSYTPKLQSALYSGADTAWVNSEVKQNQVFHDRFSYTTQLILARKFAKWLSIAITPSYTHRNYVLALANPSNGAQDENDLFSVGGGFRLKLTRSFSILADYFYVNSKYRMKNSAAPYYAPLAFGIEIETGGHVFHIDFTNAAAINPNYFIPASPDSWKNGGYKLGFNISRAFPLGGRKGGKEGEKKTAQKEPDWGDSAGQSPAKTETASPPAVVVESKPAQENEPAASPKDMYKVTAASVNMRSGPSADASLIMKISKGTSVEVVEKTNAGWWKIKYMDETGYVTSKFLSK